MQFEQIRILVMVVGLLAATWYDVFNRRNVPVYITYAMIGAGLLLNILSLDLQFIVFSSAVALLVFALGYIVYRTGQIGGADILVFAGLALLMPNSFTPLFPPPVPPLLPYPFIVSVFILSGVLAIFGVSLIHAPAIAADFLNNRPR